MTTAADAQKWFIQWSTITYGLTVREGRPWGNGTAIAQREGPTTGPSDPWDEGCQVTPLIGGYETLCQIADSLEAAITAAAGLPAGTGHVYISDWRLNPLRDLSRGNSWKTGAWSATDTAALDQTGIGLILRLMQAGVNVRVLVWQPVTAALAADYGPHMAEHEFLARVVAAEAQRLAAPDRGIVGLDLRVAKPLTAAHHQKMCVIRVGSVNVAYVGGVDWAFTRRDAPADPAATGANYHYDPSTITDPTQPAPQFNAGDWQSGPWDAGAGTGMPLPFDPPSSNHRWPQQAGVKYDAAANRAAPGRSGTDLPAQVYGDAQQIWHDQHLKLTGPIVATIEEQFRERWAFSGTPSDDFTNIMDNQVIFGQKAGAYTENITGERDIIELAPAAAAPATGSSYVQMWRTIPLRGLVGIETLSRGEFTVMAGLANAVGQATQLIWLFDQYFFSRPFAQLLNARLAASPNLHAIVVLPPFADTQPLDLMHRRKLALNDLVKGRKLAGGGYDRVAVYDTWHPGRSQGIYVHAKAKMFDDLLLVIGSANLNRRSFTCDTELDCAVLDATVLDLHQKRLWKCLFPSSPWPLSGARTGNWGKTFFSAFATAAAKNNAFLIKDPWDTETHTITTGSVSHKNPLGLTSYETVMTVTITPPTVPTTPAPTPREQSYRSDYPAYGADRVQLVGQSGTETKVPHYDLEDLIEPGSLAPRVETTTSGGEHDPGPAGRLDEIVYLIEGVPGKGNRFPFRTRP